MIEEGLEIVFKPLVIVVLGVLAESFHQCLFVDVLGYFKVR